jgi:hypothetical protein
MDQDALRGIEVGLLSALLKGGAAARDLVKSGFRPDLMPSPMGRDLARLVLRVRDAHGDVTEDVEAQIPEMHSVGAEGARLLALARSTPRPDREQALAYLALLELSETGERLRATEAQIQELLGPSAAPDHARRGAPPSPAAPDRQLRRVRLPDPRAPRPGDLPVSGKPEQE